MRWYQSLTSFQRRVLLGLAAGVVLVLGLLGWSVWQATRATPQVSPLPTPTVVWLSPTPTLTPTITPTPTPTFTPTPTPTFDVAGAGGIAAAVAEVRGGLPRWSTPLTLVDAHDLTLSLFRRYNNQPPLPLRIQPVLQALRLWFWDDVEIDSRAHSQRCAAIYVPEIEELYLRRDWTGTRAVLETQLAYGYARAISDQYGDLPRLVEEAASLDRQLALYAIAEGDALVSLWLYAGVTPGSRQSQALTYIVAQAQMPGWQPEDPLLDDLSRLTLDLGSTFATDRYTQGGLAALDDAILRPPRSTEQILHPERYDSGDEPVVLLPLDVPLGDGWTLVHEDTLGEAMLRLAVLEWGNGQATPDVVEDWGGDWLQIWYGPEENDVVLLQTAWDSAKSAGKFYGQMVGLLPRSLLPGLVRDITPAADLPRGRWWAGNRGAVFMYRAVDHVYVIWGTDSEAVEAVGVALKTWGRD